MMNDNPQLLPSLQIEEEKFRQIDQSEKEEELDVLRISTAGSVDDGKSTLIGRLLYDSKAIPEDQYEAIQRISGPNEINLALLTDGLRAEREQQITIDVAYRYFATAKRRFIIADTPGHAQYTRNMVTGASTADLAIILVDARKGLLDQSKRHAVITALLGVPQIVVAVNKMDLVSFKESVFEEIKSSFLDFIGRMAPAPTQIDFIPISALEGDNVAARSKRMPWYKGSVLIEHLESISKPATTDRPFRLPIQCVIRPHQHFRGFAGCIASGEIHVGDEVLVLPSGKRSKVQHILDSDGEIHLAREGDAVTVTLEDEIDISRGDMLVHSNTPIASSTTFEATVCWMAEKKLQLDKPYLIAQTTREVFGQVRKILHRLDVETLAKEPTTTLHLNEIGNVMITAAKPLFLDAYVLNRTTGGFILIDPATNIPVAGGMVGRPLRDLQGPKAAHSETRQTHERMNGHTGLAVLLSGTDAKAIEEAASVLDNRLLHSGIRTIKLNDQAFKKVGLNFGHDVGSVAALQVEYGMVAVIAFAGSEEIDLAEIAHSDFVRRTVEYDMAGKLRLNGQELESFMQTLLERIRPEVVI